MALMAIREAWANRWTLVDRIWTRLGPSSLPSPDNWQVWVTLAVLIRSFFFLFKVYTAPDSTVHYPGIFASEASDTVSYFGPIDSLLQAGSYSDDHRMPGYGWVYMLLRLALPVRTSLNSVAILQLLLSSISVYVLAKLAARVFQSVPYFYAVFLAFALSTYTALWDHVLLAESFCTSALVFSHYWLLTANSEKRHYLLSGLMLTWCVFLRPVTVPLLALFGLYILLRPGLGSLAGVARWRLFAAFLAPFLMLDGAWTLRNYRVHGGFYPLMTTIGYKGEKESHYGALIRFVQAFGGSTVWWAPRAEMTFFIPLPTSARSSDTTVRFRDDIYTSKFDQSSLVEVRNMLGVLRDDSVALDRKRPLEAEVIRRLDSYTISIRDEKPFLYHVVSRLRVAKTFLLHSGTYNLFTRPSSELRTWELAIKVFYSLLYCFVVLFGLLGAVWLALRGDLESRLVSFTTLFLTFVHPILFKMDEFRYLSPAYPFLILSAALFLSGVWDLVTIREARASGPETVR